MKKIIIILSLLSSTTLKAQEYQDWIHSDVAAEVVRYEKDNVIIYDLGNCNFITFDFYNFDNITDIITMDINPILFGNLAIEFEKYDDVQIRSEHFSWEAKVLLVHEMFIFVRLNEDSFRDIALNEVRQIKITRKGQPIAEWNFKYPESLCISNCAFRLWKEIREKYYLPKTGELTLEQRIEKNQIRLRELEIESKYPKF